MKKIIKKKDPFPLLKIFARNTYAHYLLYSLLDIFSQFPPSNFSCQSFHCKPTLSYSTPPNINPSDRLRHPSNKPAAKESTKTKHAILYLHSRSVGLHICSCFRIVDRLHAFRGTKQIVPNPTDPWTNLHENAGEKVVTNACGERSDSWTHLNRL